MSRRKLHADDYDDAAGCMAGDVGQLNLRYIYGCELSASGNEVMLAQVGKCHLLGAHQSSTVPLSEWRAAITNIMRS